MKSNSYSKFSVPALALITGLFLVSLASPTLAWTVHKSFESGSTGRTAISEQDGFTGDAGGATYTNEVSALGDQSAKLSVKGGTTGFGYWGGTIKFPTELEKGDNLWISLRMFIPQDFEIRTDTGSLKFLRVRQKNADGSHTGYIDNLIRMPNQSNGVFSLLKEGQHKLFHYGKRGTDDLPRNEWFRFELYVRLDETPVTQGGKAIARAWLNDKLLTEESEIQTLSNSRVTSTALYLFTYWNGEAPKSQHLYVDDIIITNETPENRDSFNNPMIGSWPSGNSGNSDPDTDTDIQAPPNSPLLQVD